MDFELPARSTPRTDVRRKVAQTNNNRDVLAHGEQRFFIATDNLLRDEVARVAKRVPSLL